MTEIMVKSGDRPLVSIGVPAFNADQFLPRALDSLLGQTYTNLELIISDNASSDGTQEICEDYLRRDCRIRYIRQPVNIGAPRNWNILVWEARGVFFKWASASDYCASQMLEKCIEVMQNHPDTVLCYGKTQFVDEHEGPLQIDENDRAINENRPSERFRHALGLGLNNMQSGVFRLDALRRTGLDRVYPHGDMVLTAEMALYGPFQMINEVFLFRRRSPKTWTSMLSPLERQRVYDPNAIAPMRFLATRRHLDHFSVIWRTPISPAERVRAYGWALRSLVKARRKIAYEFLSALAGLRRTE